MNANGNNNSGESDGITPEAIARLNLPPHVKERMLRFHHQQEVQAEALRQRESALEQKNHRVDVPKPQPQPLNDVPTTSRDVPTASPDVPSKSHDVPPKSPRVSATSQTPDLEKTRYFNLPKVPVSQQTYLEMEIEMQQHHQGRHPIDDLSAADQKALYNLLQDHASDVANILHLAPPSGFGITVTPRSLNRFKKRYAQTIHAHERAQAFQNARNIITNAGETADSFTQAAEHLLKLRLYQATNDPSTEPEDLARLYKIQRDLRRQTLAERKQTHAESKSP